MAVGILTGVFPLPYVIAERLLENPQPGPVLGLSGERSVGWKQGTEPLGDGKQRPGEEGLEEAVPNREQSHRQLLKRWTSWCVLCGHVGGLSPPSSQGPIEASWVAPPPPAGTEMEKESKHLIDALGTLTSYPAAPPDVCLSPDNRAHTAQREAFFRRMPSPLQPARAHCVPREEARERNIWGNKCVGEMCCRRVNVRWNGSCCLGSFP